MTTPNPHTTKGSDELREAISNLPVTTIGNGNGTITLIGYSVNAVVALAEAYSSQRIATANREVLDAVANAIQGSVEHMVLGDGRRDEIVRLSAARAAIQKIREGL